MGTSTAVLQGIVAEHIAAVNGFDEDAIVATFADDALVNDAHREFWGAAAIRRWIAEELVGDRVTIEVTEVIDHHGETVVRGRYDGDFDKTNLPDELILTNYFTVRAGKIVGLIVIRNTPADRTTTIRAIPSEVVLEPGEDPIPQTSAVNLDSIESVSVGVLVERIGRVGDDRMRQICAALDVAVACSA